MCFLYLLPSQVCLSKEMPVCASQMDISELVRSLVLKLLCKLCWFFFGLWNSGFFSFLSPLLIFSPKPWEHLRLWELNTEEAVQPRKLTSLSRCEAWLFLSFSRVLISRLWLSSSAFISLLTCEMKESASLSLREWWWIGEGGMRNRFAWVQILIQLLPHVLGKLLNLFVPQFPHL